LNSIAYDQTVKWSGNNDATTGTVRTQTGSYHSSVYTATELFSAVTTVQTFAENDSQWVEWTPAYGAGGGDGTAENYTFTSTVEVYCTSAQSQVFTFKDSDDNTTSTTITSTGWTTIKTGGGVLKSIKSQASSGQYSHWSGIRIDGKWLIDSDVTTANVPSLVSTYRANPSAGFSIVSYTGTGAVGTIAHGLNAKIDFAIFKNREDTQSWAVYHKEMGNTHYIKLDWGIVPVDDVNAWNDTDPRPSFMTLGDNTSVNASTEEIVAYMWSEVEGYSKFGKYIGNGAADGPFIYCGFKPAFIMFGSNVNYSDWYIYDNERWPHNPAEDPLAANETMTEANFDARPITNHIDILSNGFKLRFADTSGYHNYSTWTYSFVAFADSPFKYSNAR